MLKRVRQRFGSLRWQLTGAYVLVSLLLALTLISVFVGAIVWLLSSDLVLNEFLGGTRALATSLRRQYEDPGRTPQSLGEQLRVIVAQNDQARSAQPQEAPSLSFDIGPADSEPASTYFVALLDTEGRVITSTAPLEVPNGALLADSEAPAARAVIAAALAGSADESRLVAWVEPEHEPIAAAPVVGDGGVLGVVYTRFSGIPSPRVLLANLPPFLATFLLPWLVVSGGMGMLFAWVAGRSISRRVGRLAEASAALASGDLTRRVEDRSADEIGQLAEQFNAMAGRLEEHVHALRLLAERNAQLAEQAAQLATVEERNRLARDLHDSVSQELFSLTMLAAAARRTLERSPEQAAEQLGEIQAGAQRALQETRGLIFALRPAALGDRGLAPALRDLAANVQERQGIRLELRVSGERRLPLDYEQALFRIAQEALANVARHSGAGAAEIELRYEDDAVRMAVSDGGRGFDPHAEAGRSVGLASMAERAAQLGGRVTVTSAPGQGTRVAVVVPTAGGDGVAR